MSTIASPRPSITLSSRRTSISTDTTARSPSTSRAPATSNRRNRAALREFYGLKDQETPSSESSTPARGSSLEETRPESKLDKPEFNAESYVKEILAKESLEGVLKAEAGIVSGRFLPSITTK